MHVRVHGELWRVSGPRLHSKSETLKLGNLMARLPQQYAPLVYGLIQAAITTAGLWRNGCLLGVSLFDHAAGCGLRFTVYPALCLGSNGFDC